MVLLLQMWYQCPLVGPHGLQYCQHVVQQGWSHNHVSYSVQWLVHNVLLLATPGKQQGLQMSHYAALVCMHDEIIPYIVATTQNKYLEDKNSNQLEYTIISPSVC